MKDLSKFDIIRVFDEKVIENNLKKIKAKSKAELGIVIKANAYGFSLNRIIPILKKNKIKSYFCQDIIEALSTKKLLKDNSCDVYVFAGVQDEQAKAFQNNKIIPICINLDQIKYYNDESKGLKSKPRIGIHFDTGMNRTGLSFEEVEKLGDNWKTYTSNLDVILYVSHLHSSCVKDNSNAKQLKVLNNILEILPKNKVSLSATGGLLNLPDNCQFDLLRIGEGMYRPSIEGTKYPVSVYAKILQVREVKKSETIGYFGGYKAPHDMKIAIINIGYKDGYSRSLSKTNSFKDKIRKIFRSGTNFATSYMSLVGYKLPVVGIISMNNTMVDVSKVPSGILKLEKWVEVMGSDVNLNDFREGNGFIPIDLTVSLTGYNPNAIDMSHKEFLKIIQYIL